MLPKATFHLKKNAKRNKKVRRSTIIIALSSVEATSIKRARSSMVTQAKAHVMGSMALFSDNHKPKGRGVRQS